MFVGNTTEGEVLGYSLIPRGAAVDAFSPLGGGSKGTNSGVRKNERMASNSGPEGNPEVRYGLWDRGRKGHSSDGLPGGNGRSGSAGRPEDWFWGRFLFWAWRPAMAWRPRRTLRRRISGPGGGHHPPTSPRPPPPAEPLDFEEAPPHPTPGSMPALRMCGSPHAPRQTTLMRTAILPGIHLNPFDFRS